MYVWCDALANYISGVSTGDIENDFKNWNCELHVIGKDISRFHCLTWIGMLLSAEINLPKNILIHGFVNDRDGAKMSKSVGNVVDPHIMIDEYGSDTLRLYMTSEIGVGQDLNFSDERIKVIHNDVLANNYGNLVNRVLSLWIAYRDGGGETLEIPETTQTTKSILQMYETCTREYSTQSAFAQIDALLNEANSMLNTTEPWKKSGIEKGKLLVAGIIYVYYATLLLSPFIPTATEKVMKAMGMKEATTLDVSPEIDLATITKPDILFVKK